MIFWLWPFQQLGKHRSCCCCPRGHRSQCFPSWRQGRAAQGAAHAHSGTACVATTQPQGPEGAGTHCTLVSSEAELGNVLKQRAPEQNIFTASACVWQRASSERHGKDMDKQLLRSQNILFQHFQNSRAELFALKIPVSDKKALKKIKTIF